MLWIVSVLFLSLFSNRISHHVIDNAKYTGDRAKSEKVPCIVSLCLSLSLSHPGFAHVYRICLFNLCVREVVFSSLIHNLFITWKFSFRKVGIVMCVSVRVHLLAGGRALSVLVRACCDPYADFWLLSDSPCLQVRASTMHYETVWISTFVTWEESSIHFRQVEQWLYGHQSHSPEQDRVKDTVSRNEQVGQKRKKSHPKDSKAMGDELEK